MEIKNRKSDHIRISLKEDVESKITTGFERISFIHKCLPEIDFKDIDLNTIFLGKKLNYPIQISGMVGGDSEALKINRNLAQVAEELNIAMGVGSQRIALETDKSESFRVVRDEAPNAFIIGNLGAVQLNYGMGTKEILAAKEMIDADAIALHMNPTQELVQPEGNLNFSGLLKKIEKVCKEVKFPIIAKEVGNGISGEVAAQLEKAGVSALDVQGAGGTSWALVESYRSNRNAELGQKLSNWGIPTLYSLLQCKSNTKLPVIASGGIRDGFDAAKALAMGADLVGIALPLLKSGVTSAEKVRNELEKMIKEIKACMFLTGSSNLKELNKEKVNLG